MTEGRRLRLLIIEDDQDTAELLRELLELAGHRVTVAYDGRTGVERAREAKPDAVLCDLGLPDDTSGFDVARELRKARDTRDLHLVAVSGHGRPEDIRRAAEAGFEAHMTKPVTLATLTRVLDEVGAR